MSNVINITVENIQADLLQRSEEKLIIIDFWADWCEPCKQLMPVLEKLAQEYAEQVVLAKINCDEQQAIAMQFGIKSLPTVMLFKDGQALDGFAGMQPESEIRAMLDKHLPKQQDEWFAQGVALAEQKQWAEAYPLLKQAYEAESERVSFLLMFANASIELGRLDEAQGLLEKVRMADQDGAYQQVLAKLELAKQASDTPEIQALSQSLEAEPDSLQIKQDLAVALHSANRDDEALALLLQVLAKDMSFGEAKKTFLDIIASLPDGDSVKATYRRKLYTLLY
jgi:putative thioredoxin